MNTTLTVFTRDASTSITLTGPTCRLEQLTAAAVAAGMTMCVGAFDIHLPSGALAWTWEQR